VKDHTESYKMSIADTGPLPASAMEEKSDAEHGPTNSWLAAEARRRERARMQAEPIRKDLVTRQGRRLASGTSYLSVPSQSKGPAVESRADTIEQFEPHRCNDTEENLKVATD
jgi:hypothetical protein